MISTSFGEILPVDGVAEAAHESAERLERSFAFLDLAVVVGAALAVAVPILGDRGHVDGVVHPPVATPG
jgi:hypothetical protein